MPFVLPFAICVARSVAWESSCVCGNRISYIFCYFRFGSQKQYLQSLDLFCTGFFKGKFKVKIVCFCVCVINLKSENTSYVFVCISGSGKHSRFVLFGSFAASQTTITFALPFFVYAFHLVGSLVFVFVTFCWLSLKFF